MSLNKSVCLLAAAMLFWSIGEVFAQSADNAGFDHRHSLFDELLHSHVDAAGLVDYQALQADQAQLTDYQWTLAGVSSEQLKDWSQAQQLAFWINAYNAFTLRAIIDHYPIRRGSFKGLFAPRNSILQIPGVWKELEWEAGGQAITLDQIEHRILRVEFSEPRIHFAIVCASISCPDLRPEAYTAEHIDAQLAEQLQVFIGNPDKGVAIDREDDEVQLSKIFSWFGEDFAVSGNDEQLFTSRAEKKADVLRYLVRHFPPGDDLQYLLNGDFDIAYLDYDWNLNDQRNDR